MGCLKNIGNGGKQNGRFGSFIGTFWYKKRI